MWNASAILRHHALGVESHEGEQFGVVRPTLDDLLDKLAVGSDPDRAEEREARQP